MSQIEDLQAEIAQLKSALNEAMERYAAQIMYSQAEILALRHALLKPESEETAAFYKSRELTLKRNEEQSFRRRLIGLDFYV